MESTKTTTTTSFIINENKYILQNLLSLILFAVMNIVDGWMIVCLLNHTGVETYSCIKIDYFSEKGYQPDPHDSSSAIPCKYDFIVIFS